ncbi:tetratricopeptide repeat protein [Pedobacter xixiisoli]|uniref:Tetratricopeptide repeat-containing protein n=1 Tax=Pedobacter xixiisoli TaxID=1476464 RepID=A0A285ZQ01_9SPHI|nr:hypothetical protein [Pedobacter xixiisoli]SOD11712.1 Tetratricopeptide repeat-containing protein [Pedobacter xixiisoli]
MKNLKRTIFLALTAVTFGLQSCNTNNIDKADKYYKEDNITEAIKHYELAIEEGDTTATNKLALLYANEHQPEKAKAVYIKSFEKGNTFAAQYLANISLRDEKYDDVIKYAKPLVDKGHIEMVYALGSAYLKLKQYDDAIKYLSMDAENVYVKDPLGQSYYDKKDYANAEKYWKSAVDDHKSGAINSYNKLLNLYKELGRQKDYEAYNGKY